MSGARMKPWQIYAITVAATIATLVLRLAFGSVFEGRPTLSIFILPIMLGAYLGGMGAGMLATGLSYLFAAYYLLPPTHSFLIATSGEAWDAILVVLDGTVISALNEVFHRARRRSEEKRAQLYNIVNSSSYAVIGKTLDGVITSWNGGAEKMFGHSAAEAVGCSMRMLIPPGRVGEEPARLARIARGETVDHFETVRVHKDGRHVHISASISPVIDGGGQVVGASMIARDTTRRWQAESQLRASEARYRRTLDGILEGCQLIGFDWTYLYLNDASAVHNRRPNEELLGRKMTEAWPGIENTGVFALLRRCMEERVPFHEEVEFAFPEGEKGWFDVRTHPVPEGIFVLSLNVTERRRAEDALLEAEVLQNAIFNSTNLCSITTDANGLIQIFNVGAERMLGYAADEVTNRITPADLHDPQELIARAAALSAEMGTPIAPGFEVLVYKAAQGIENMYELTKVRKDGSRFPVVVSVTALRDVEDAIIGYLLISTDNTARKRAEQKVSETTAMLHSVLDSASEVSVIATEPDLTIKIFNRGAERLLGYAAHEVVGVATQMLLHDPAEVEARGAELSAQLQRPVEGAGVFLEPSTLRLPREWLYVCKDGRRVSVSLVMTAMYRDDGALLGYLGVAYDVTRQKAIEETLRAATHSAELASMAKSQFLTNMSHEIRTPMHAVIGLTYLLDQTDLDAAQTDLLEKIKFASKSLLTVITDVLDLSKIEAGELRLERVTFKLRHMLRRLSGSMSVHALAKRIAFEIDVQDDLPEAVQGDATRLQQILTNLLFNAIKFTERGGVKLVVRLLNETADQFTLKFAVHDTGIGIPPEMKARLFTPFAQADASTTRRFGGTGLGLSIVKRLTDLAGGTVGVESTLGVGTEFWVVLDFARASADALLLQVTESDLLGRQGLVGVRVLVVDDSEINLEVARRMLELEGAEVALASNGGDAIELLRAESTGFDVVLMDMQMPILDGNAVARRIRGDLGLRTLPIIALTASALTSERERSIAAGMDDFISKPFDARTLVRSIRRLVPPLPVWTDADPLAQGASLPSSWPEIEGIDSNDVRSRLGDDLALFRSMMRRLLAEYPQHSFDEDVADTELHAMRARRMHKLRGTAGMLGAKTVGGLAGKAEAAYVEGDGVLAASLEGLTAAALQVLRIGSQPMLVASQAALQSPPDSERTEFDSQAMGELIRLLRQQSLTALNRFDAVSHALRGKLGPTSYARVSALVDDLKFNDAADALETCDR
ncbi:MAG: PAS domain S-box protein [Caldimonas sp.]